MTRNARRRVSPEPGAMGSDEAKQLRLGTANNRFETAETMNNHFMKRGRNQRRRQGGGPNPNRALDSNGPDVRIRGTAQQIYDKYQALARDAQSSGDRVKAENYLQHAEHYFRVLRSVQGSAPVSQFDQNQDNDYDADQPGVGEGRETRNERPQHQSFPNDDQNDSEQSGDDQPDVPAYSAVAPEPRNEQRSQNANGGHSNASNGGDHESRRRRRRPRRPREEGAPAEGVEASDEPEPAPA